MSSGISMNIEERKQHLKNLRLALFKRFCVLELRAASLGTETPASVIVEIGDLRDEIAKIDAELATLGISSPAKQQVTSNGRAVVQIRFKGKLSELTPERR